MVRSISNQYVKKQSNQHTTPKIPRAASTYVPTTTSTAGVIASKSSTFLYLSNTKSYSSFGFGKDWK